MTFGSNNFWFIFSLEATAIFFHNPFFCCDLRFLVPWPFSYQPLPSLSLHTAAVITLPFVHHQSHDWPVKISSSVSRPVIKKLVPVTGKKNSSKDSVLALAFMSLTASQETSNIPFPWFQDAISWPSLLSQLMNEFLAGKNLFICKSASNHK